ncbi:MAG: SPOR domain-containing protein [Prevotella sp.]|nr:SPOR domain-containing protein [Prevotella sp.]
MRKYLIIAACVCTGIAFTSCGSSKESAYRKAYEKAKAQEQSQQPAQQQVVQQPVQQTVQQAPVVTPLVEAPAQQQQAQVGNVAVRSERVSVVNGAGLKAYSVVVGSFGVQANALGLQNTLKNAGYSAQVAFNQERNMYRVIVATFDTRDAAVQCKQSLLGTYPDAWLLMQQ